jgi:hypothetical protein
MAAVAAEQVAASEVVAAASAGVEGAVEVVVDAAPTSGSSTTSC